MYTFNDFQKETCISKLYSSAVEKQIMFYMGLCANASTEYDINYAENRNEKVDKFTKTFIASAGIFSLVTLLMNGPSLGTYFSAGAVTLEFVVLPIIRGLVKQRIVAQAANENFLNFMDDLTITMAKSSNKNISDEEIHEMTESLQNGEVEKKYEYIDSLGKCPIYLIETSCGNVSSEISYPLNDIDLERFFEVIMHVASKADNGYEELIKEGYQLAKKYNEVTISSYYSKEAKDAVLQELLNFESKVARRSRS